MCHDLVIDVPCETDAELPDEINELYDEHCEAVRQPLEDELCPLCSHNRGMGRQPTTVSTTAPAPLAPARRTTTPQQLSVQAQSCGSLPPPQISTNPSTQPNQLQTPIPLRAPTPIRETSAPVSVRHPLPTASPVYLHTPTFYPPVMATDEWKDTPRKTSSMYLL